MAEGVGFEPTRGFRPPTVFKTVSLNRSDTPPGSLAVPPSITR